MGKRNRTRKIRGGMFEGLRGTFSNWTDQATARINELKNKVTGQPPPYQSVGGTRKRRKSRRRKRK